MADARDPDEVAPRRYVTQHELDSCMSDIRSQLQVHLGRSERGTESLISAFSSDVEKKLSAIPSKEERRNSWLGTAALIMAGLALLQMWFMSGFDASEKKDGLQDSIEANQAVIAEILKIQKRNEERTEVDSRNLKILIGDHDHKLEFEDEKPK